MLLPLGPGGIDLACIEALALLGVAKQIVGAGNLLELLLGRFVARIEVGM